MPKRTLLAVGLAVTLVACNDGVVLTSPTLLAVSISDPGGDARSLDSVDISPDLVSAEVEIMADSTLKLSVRL